MAKKTKADFVQYYSKLSHDMQSLENAIDNHIYNKERKTHRSFLVVQIKSCIFALSVQDIKTS